MATTFPDHLAGDPADSLILLTRRSALPQRRFAISGLIIVAAIVYLVVSSFSTAVAAVLSPSALVGRGRASYGSTVRLQGQVIAPLRETANGHQFQVSDGRTIVRVSYPSDLPGGFKVGASVEAQGTYNGQLFTATGMTAKCPTKYQAAPASRYGS